MLFSSLIFLFVFLPILLAAYYLLHSSLRNWILLLFSIAFYAWGGVSYTAILLISIMVNYVFVKQIEKDNPPDKNYKKTWLIIGLVFNVIVIAVFKYLDFTIENLNGIGSFLVNDYEPMPLKNIVLPLGISFFTFQQMSLLWDIYRGENDEKVRFLDAALYISLFPQLIAGPIVRYKDIADQIKSRIESIELFRSGIQRFLVGLFKKVVIANTCGELADEIMLSSLENINTPIAWLGIIAYTFQIYFDFSGYSDMAIGLGRMFGFKILENFNFPYISKSIQEFWRRWHISLSTWFRDYLYIPLGGNRKGPYRTYFNLMLVFLLTGFWHGATWSFIIWGLYHGLFLIIERVGFIKVLKKAPAFLSWLYMMLVVMIGWVLFKIESIGDALNYIIRLFGIGESNKNFIASYLNTERAIILTLAILLSSKFFFNARDIINKYNIQKTVIYKMTVDASLIFIFIYSIMYINSGSYNPFIYFRF